MKLITFSFIIHFLRMLKNILFKNGKCLLSTHDFNFENLKLYF